MPSAQCSAWSAHLNFAVNPFMCKGIIQHFCWLPGAVLLVHSQWMYLLFFIPFFVCFVNETVFISLCVHLFPYVLLPVGWPYNGFDWVFKGFPLCIKSMSCFATIRAFLSSKWNGTVHEEIDVILTFVYLHQFMKKKKKTVNWLIIWVGLSTHS